MLPEYWQFTGQVFGLPVSGGVFGLSGERGWGIYLPFLDAPSHLYKRMCPSVRPWVRGSVSIKEKRELGASYVGYPTLL